MSHDGTIDTTGSAAEAGCLGSMEVDAPGPVAACYSPAVTSISPVAAHHEDVMSKPTKKKTKKKPGKATVKKAVIRNDELWKRIPGFSDYEASDKGGVRVEDRESQGARAGLVLKPSPDPGGRRYIVLSDDKGKRCNVSVAKIVLLAHAGRPKPGHDKVIHGPKGLRSDTLSNIRWGTAAEQWAAARAGGLMVGFAGMKATVVTEAIARAAMTEIVAGKTSVRGYAAKHKLPRTSLQDAIDRLRSKRKSAA